jgi:hypothetical protein
MSTLRSFITARLLDRKYKTIGVMFASSAVSSISSTLIMSFVEPHYCTLIMTSNPCLTRSSYSIHKLEGASMSGIK